MAHMPDLLRELIALPGPSGFEQAPAHYMLRAFRKRGAYAAIDVMGNVVAHIPGTESDKKLLLCAHTDEVGFIVRHIDAAGMAAFDPIGLLNPEALPGAQVDLIVEMGAQPHTFPGVIGTRSAHLAAGPPPSLADLWIDTGLKGRAAVEAAGIHIGTPATFRPNFSHMGNTCVASKALDNRMGCALLLQVLEGIAGRALPFHLYLAAVVQEEVGSRGAQVVARRLRPAWAIAIDTVPAADPATPQTAVEVGAGPSIRAMDMMPNMMGTLYAPAITAYLEALAEANNIPFQRDVSHTWTDAATMEGVLRGGVYVPRRYAHGPAELMCLQDMEAAFCLLFALVTCERTAAQLGRGPWPG